MNPVMIGLIGMIHAKRTLDSVWCDQSIFGKLTNHEGDENGPFKVTCPKCLEKKKEPKCSKCGRIYCDH